MGVVGVACETGVAFVGVVGVACETGVAFVGVVGAGGETGVAFVGVNGLILGVSRRALVLRVSCRFVLLVPSRSVSSAQQ